MRRIENALRKPSLGNAFLIIFGSFFEKGAQKSSFSIGFIMFWALIFSMCVLPITPNVFCDFWGPLRRHPELGASQEPQSYCRPAWGGGVPPRQTPPPLPPLPPPTRGGYAPIIATPTSIGFYFIYYFYFSYFFAVSPPQRVNYLFYRRAGPVDFILFILLILFIFLRWPWGRKRDNYLFYCPPAGSWPISLRNL